MPQSSPFRSTLNTGYITVGQVWSMYQSSPIPSRFEHGLHYSFGHVWSIYQSSPFRSTLNTALDMCEVNVPKQSINVGGADGRRAGPPTTTTSIDFIDVSRCLATSIEIDKCIRRGWAQTTATTTTTSIDFIDVSGCRDVDRSYRCLCRMSRDVDRFYRCLWMSRDVDRFYRCRMSRDVDRFYRCLWMSRDVDRFYRCLWMSRDVDRFYRCLWMSRDVDRFIDVSGCLATSIDLSMSLDVSRRR